MEETTKRDIKFTIELESYFKLADITRRFGYENMSKAIEALIEGVKLDG